MEDHDERTGVVVRVGIVLGVVVVVDIVDEVGVGVRHYYKVSWMGHLVDVRSIRQR